MTIGKLRSDFMELLNRDDCTEDQADRFLSLGIRRMERKLRTPMQKALFEVTVDPTYLGFLPAPTDYIALDYVKVNGLIMRRATVTSIDPSESVGVPEAFYFDHGKFRFQPALKHGDAIQISYYREMHYTSDSDASPAVSLVANDLAMYAALIFACDFFADLRKPSFENTFVQLVGELQEMADMDEMAGSYMAVRNPYEGIV